MNHPIEPIIREALFALAEEFRDDSQRQREREMVSRFCFGHLVHKCAAGTFLHHPTQIGIEVRVPQNNGQAQLTGRPTAKKQVCKDIVIWPRPGMTCWDDLGSPTVAPACVLEWKHNEKSVSGYDLEWLAAFSAGRPEFVGFAVCTQDRSFGTFRLSCTRVFNGHIQPQWLFVE